MELSLPVLGTWVFPDRESNPDLPHAKQTLYQFTSAAVSVNLYQYIDLKNYKKNNYYLPFKKRISVSYEWKKE